MLVYSDGETPITKGFTVVICDDHPQMRGGLRNVLTGMLGCEVVGETDRGEEALLLSERLRPDMLVLDLSLAGAMNGRAVLSEIRHRRLPVKVFVYTVFLCRDDLEEWYSDPDGPDGVDEKGSGDKELAIGFTQVLLTDQKYVPMRLIKKLMEGSRSKGLDQLTAKEFLVVRLAARQDLSMQEIAKRLNNTPSTVRVHLTTIYGKLGLEQHNRAALLSFYYAHHEDILL
jgi:DNA-binding NarL/FixJ family response regulator